MKKRKSAFLYAAAGVSLGVLYLIAGVKKGVSSRRFYAVAGLALLVLFLGLGGCLNQKPTKSRITYKTDSVFTSSIVKRAVASGSVVPRKQIAVKAQVSGIIEKVYVTAGQTVTAGQLLARVKLTPNAVELNGAENDLQKAQLSYNDAKHEKERYEKLFQEKVVAEKEYNQYLLAFQKAAADLSAARNNVQLVKVGASSGMAANEVRSTVNGVLLDVPAKEGNFVIERNTFNEGTTIATIADMNDMIFMGKVEEADVSGLQTGMELDITVRATEEKTYKARLEFISPNGVKEDGATNFEIRAAILMDKKDFLRAGYSANADIVLEKRDNVLCLRESLVRFDDRKPYVEVEVQPQVFEKRYVQLGLSDEINIQVLEGLKPNERVKAVF
jgi:HlyD family secretion protein